ncbi:minor tail protein [Microbacterium phage Mercedes]|nr:minor tail protein [Microbacterium phage Mercedes]
MASNAVNIGAAGQLYIEANVIGIEPWNNRSLVSWAFYLRERVSSGSTWIGSPVSAGVTTPGFGLWNGGFTFDWRPGGLQNTLIASGTFWAGHNADGYGSTIVAGSIGNTGTSGAGGPGSVDVFLDLGRLQVAPGAVQGPTATYISDTQVQVNWTNTGASNGQPDRNQIYKSVNGSGWQLVADIQATNSAVVSVNPNEAVYFTVNASNGSGTGYGGVSQTIYTTPGAPTNGVATKNTALDIVLTFDENVAYSEYNHEIQHGVVAGGVTTWDAGILATLPSGTLTYTHAAPNASQVHVYRIRAKAGDRTSAWLQTNSVQLLVAPNKPTLPAMPAFADRALALDFEWVHNSVDTTPQKAYEFAYSTNGGTNWTSTGKINSAVMKRTMPANAYASGTALTTRVRTWGSATTGGSDGTGASPWSDLRTVTYKTAPVATITSPATGGTINDATVRVTLGFTQAEGATFVKAQLELSQGGTLLETLESTILAGIALNTQAQNGLSYTVRARVQDSNGLWSSWKTSTFNVTYLAPVPAGVVVSFLPDSGYGQVDLTIPAPASGQSAAATVTVTRKISGVEEVLVANYPVSASLSFLDTLPTTHGVNTYTVTTTSALGAKTTVVKDLVTEECRRAYLSKGASYTAVVVFGGNLAVDQSLSVASSTVEAAGRTKPIGLYGVETAVQLKVKSFIHPREGFSSVEQIRTMLLTPGKACYRDPSGRRIFGTVKGSLAQKRTDQADLAFTLVETS